jgi:hypothetical protein
MAYTTFSRPCEQRCAETAAAFLSIDSTYPFGAKPAISSTQVCAVVDVR